MRLEFGSILITGASSGIGAALARRAAAPGVTLALHGRDAARLAAVAADCRARGAGVTTACFDLTEPGRIGDWLAEVDAACPLDLVIANAGISGGSSGATEPAAQTRRILAVNLFGLLDTIEPAIERMRGRGRGSIALMSSLASFRGMPGTAAYCASKAAVRVLGEALRGSLAADGVRLSVICPGFVATPMTARNRFPMPFLMDAERAAAITLDRLARGRARIAYPWPMLLLALALTALPPLWVDRWILGLPRKAPLREGPGRG